MKTRLLSYLLLLVVYIIAGASHAAAIQTLFRDGDIIFHKSQSAQSAALQEATQSPWTHVGILFKQNNTWYVAEAVEPVKVTSLTSFVNRGKKKEYRVYRPKVLDVKNPAPLLTKLKNEILPYMGLHYDIYFEWDDDLIYCSELVYKAYYDALNVEIGTVQKVGELKLDGPLIKKLIKERLTPAGKTLNRNEPIVTPVSQILSPNLKLIYRSH